MSESSDDHDREFAPLTFVEVAEFLDWKSKDITCEICENNTWGLMNSPQETFTLTRMDLKRHLPRGNIPLFVMECTNCGNMKLFRQHGIREKLVKRRLDALEDGDA